MKLDLGSGVKKRPGFIGVDIARRALVDVRADIEAGLPFKDNTFSEVWMNHVFEHLTDPVRVMEEIWRICRSGATVEIRGPHFSRPYLVWGDPTHKRPLSLGTFQYFDGRWHCSEARYEILSCTLRKGNSSFAETGWKPWYWPFVVSNFVIEKLVNTSPAWITRYERLASRFIGFDEIQIVLAVSKNDKEG